MFTTVAYVPPLTLAFTSFNPACTVCVPFNNPVGISVPSVKVPPLRAASKSVKLSFVELDKVVIAVSAPVV